MFSMFKYLNPIGVSGSLLGVYLGLFSLIENIIGKKGGVVIPLRGTPEGGWSMEHHNPLMRESRGRTRHTPGREHETLRSI
jgi:hypothetical protein